MERCDKSYELFGLWNANAIENDCEIAFDVLKNNLTLLLVVQNQFVFL